MDNLFTSQKHKRESAVDVVINNIKRLLLTKKLLPGDRLPNETDLSKSLSVSRGSVREAMKIFSALGIVEVRQGDGTYIAKSINNVLFDPLLLSLILSQSDIKELAEFRELIEIDVIKLIIRYADGNDLNKIKSAYMEMEKEINNQIADPSVLSQYDLKFHYALGSATNNKLIEKIYNFILDFFAPSIEKTHENQINGLEALSTHKKILDALTKKDLNAAVESIQSSVAVWKDLLSKVSKD